MKRTIITVFLAAIYLSSAVQSQVVWQKQINNPVVPGWSGNVNDPNGLKSILEPSTLFDSSQNVYRMWFSSLAGSYGASGCISTALSLDGQHWYFLAGNPVLRPGAQSDFDYAFLYAGDVIHVGNTYSMYYSGADQNGRISIGLATSSDGIIWQKYAQNPVLVPGAVNAWDSHNVAYPRVIFDGAVYRMWFTGGDATYAGAGYATSPDGIHWTKSPANPVLTRGTSGNWDDNGVGPAGVAQRDTLYYMLYAGSSVQSGPNVGIGLAVSSDGMNWKKNQSNPVIVRGSSGQWDDQMLGGGSLRYINGHFAFWYTAYSYSTGEWQTGMATSSFVPVSVEQRANPLPAGYVLAQSYPNPFNPSVTIEYTLPREEFVAITVFDETGRQVVTLEQEKRGAGIHSTTWDATNVASGTYYYRFTAGNVALTKKMILLK